MAKAISLHIGINKLDPGHYAGWDGVLAACENDALAMQSIAAAKGYETNILLTKDATRGAVESAILKASGELEAGGIFLLSYAGHGGSIPDESKDEKDGWDETWCLYDGQILDDELVILYGNFAEGTRVLVFSDSCHSGTVIRENPASTRPMPRYREMPRDVASKVYGASRKFYDRLQKGFKGREDEGPASSVKLISGCQDHEFARDGDVNGLFTATLLKVWDKGHFNGDYGEFHEMIVQNMPPDQRPNLFNIGPEDESFNSQAPFTIQTQEEFKHVET